MPGGTDIASSADRLQETASTRPDLIGRSLLTSQAWQRKFVTFAPVLALLYWSDDHDNGHELGAGA
jgi:hypothetical protein